MGRRDNHAWEQRKLGDYVIIRSGWSPSNFDINNNANNLFIKVDDLNYSTRVQKESQVKVNILSKYKKMKKSSTIFPKRGAAIMTNKVRMLGEDSYMDTNMMALEPKGIDPEYLYTFINKTGLYKIADTSTIPQINNKHIEPYLLLIPSLEEQHKIGSFFKQLDETIALHQRKCEQTKELKKFMLQKMFPKKGEKNPEIRFPGFTDDWEQRKLIDYLEVSKEKNKNEVFGKEDVLSVSGDYGIVNQIEFQGRSFAGASVAPYGIVDTGDIVYTKSPLKSNPYGIIKANKGKAGIVSTLYAVYKPLDNVCSDFVQIYFEQDARMNNYMHPLVNKGAKNDMKVSDVNALKGEVCFPSKDEQIKISEHFANLDRLITLHQRKDFVRFTL